MTRKFNKQPSKAYLEAVKKLLDTTKNEPRKKKPFNQQRKNDES